MNNDFENNLEENNESNTENTVESDKKNNLITYLVASLFIIILILFGIAGFIVLSEEETQVTDVDSTTLITDKNIKSDNRIKSLNNLGELVDIDPFTVNLLSNNGRRYLKVHLELEVYDSDVVLELERKTPVIRDVIIRILSSQSIQDISTLKGKDKLKKILLDNLNRYLNEGHIIDLYYTEFVMQ